MGVSEPTFYRWKHILQHGQVERQVSD